MLVRMHICSSARLPKAEAGEPPTIGVQGQRGDAVLLDAEAGQRHRAQPVKVRAGRLLDQRHGQLPQVVQLQDTIHSCSRGGRL